MIDMARLLGTWIPFVVLLVGWILGWLLLWQAYLFDRFGRDPEPRLTVFEDTGGDLRILWIASITGLLLLGLGVAFLAFRAIFASHSLVWSRTWLVSGVVLIVVGLSFPVLFPSKTVILVDEEAGVVSMQSRWLYAGTTESLSFHELLRINLRVRETPRKIGASEKCLIGTGLSLIREQGPALRVPEGFDHEAVAARLAEVSGAKLDLHETREC